MADSEDIPNLPENREALEQLIEAAIARLDEMEDDRDLEPTLGSTLSLDLAGTAWPGLVGELADPNIDECEEVCEDEGAACEDEGALSMTGATAPKTRQYPTNGLVQKNSGAPQRPARRQWSSCALSSAGRAGNRSVRSV